MTLPNILSFIRLLLVVPLIYLILDASYGWALLVIIVAALTDFFDGFLARLMNWRSSLGMVLDPAADKVLVVGSFIAFYFAKLIPLWLIVLFVARDLQMIAGYFHLRHLKRSKEKLKPLLIGKLTRATQIILGVLIVVHLNWQLALPLHALFIICGSITALSMLVYLRRWILLQRL